MKGLILLPLALLLVGCERLPGASEAAVHVRASYDFKAGCIVVEAHDKGAPDKAQSQRVVVKERPPPAKVDIAVFRGADWSRTLDITLTAHEQKCDGPEVARESREYTLKKAGVETLDVTLSATDADGDGYMALSSGGTDCDDSDPESNPGVTTEACDGRDNDCRNGVDDGLTFTDYFLDEDGDGVGAGAPVHACAAPDHYVALSGDCDDHDSLRAPGKLEVCDERDNDCDGDVDEGLPTSPFYRDADGDGFGDPASEVQKCRAPAGYVAATSSFDCNDADPAVKPGATELCNGVDDNCASGIDETFTQKGTSCSANGCSGKYICNGAQDGVVCDAPMPTGYYPDADGDGEGAMSAAVQNVCPPGPAPAGKVANNTDCDDNDPYNKSTGTEVCDDRDNNCANGKSDEAAVCAGKGWRELTSPTIPTARDWRTVALGAGGSPVWLAGASGALAYRASSSSGNFTEFYQKCGTNNWNASWVRPSDGTVFLAGDGGNLAAYDGAASSCTQANTTSASGGTTSSHPLTGIVGFESSGVTTVYVVNDDGQVFSWVPGNAPAYKAERTLALPYWDIHGAAVSRLLIAAAATSGEHPNIHAYNASTDTLTGHSFSGVPASNDSSVLGIWSWDTSHAMAVGKKGLLLRWDGSTTWYFASPDSSMTVDLNSVVALDAYSVYVAGQDGKIRRSGSSSWLVHFTASGALKDIAASSRQDLWAVGNGLVVHFPEP